MRSTSRAAQRLCFLIVALSLAGCSGGTTANPTPQSIGQSQAQGGAVLLSRPQPTPSPAPTSTTSFTGRIVYETGGTLHIYNLATKTDVSLGISGINPKFSPDGTLITYGGVRVMNSDGTNNRVLNATGGVPSFDPTGTMIVYSDNGIWRINVDGTGRTQLTSTRGIAPTYSPDGTQIAYNLAAGTGNGQQLFIMNADGTNAHQALTSASILDTVWRPSGKILFGMSGLYSYDPSTPAIPPTRLAANGFEPSWSPDATHISWTNGTKSGIWIMNADGTGQQGPVIPNGRQGSWGP